LGKCKEALVQNTDDLEAAEKWLYSRAQAEGWAKVEVLRGRAAKQGLIGLLTRGNMGAMVEVNNVN
jgi:elongation factor Ts